MALELSTITARTAGGLQVRIPSWHPNGQMQLTQLRLDFHVDNYFGRDGIGSDATAAIAAATDDAQAAGGVVVFGAGEYEVLGPLKGAAINVTGSVSFRGQGRYRSIIRNATAEYDSGILSAVDAQRIEVCDLGFDGNVSVQRVAWNFALDFRGCLDVVVDNCWLYRTGNHAVRFAKTGPGGTDGLADGTVNPGRFWFADNHVQTCWGSPAVITKFGGASSLVITGNVFHHLAIGAVSIESEARGGLAAEETERVVIADNVIYDVDATRYGSGNDVAYGVVITERVRDVVCSNNTIQDVSGTTFAVGIIMSTSPVQTDTPVRRVVVANNTINNVQATSGRGHGINLVAGDNDLDRVTVANNIITDCECGLSFTPDAAAKTVGVIRDCTITGNVITGSSIGGIWYSLTDDSTHPVRDCTFVGNVIVDNAGDGVYLLASGCTFIGNIVDRNAFGFRLFAGSGRCSFTGNQANENQLSGMIINGDRHVLTGNMALNNGQADAGTYYGCYIETGDYCVVVENSFSDTQDTPTQDYGFRGPATTRVRGNDLLGNGQAFWNGAANYNEGDLDGHGNRTSTTPQAGSYTYALQFGTSYLWTYLGKLYVKSGSKPTGNTDGTIVGTQS